MVRLFALGGLGEVGMNCLAVEDGGRLLLVDCGVGFESRALGAPIVHPDFAALEAWRDRIDGVFLTHGHEDHIGALPYLLAQHDVPVWGPEHAIALLRERAGEHEVLGHARLEAVRPGDRVATGAFEVEPVRVAHSIADATALCIGTSAGVVVHTGDFKLDPAPPDGCTTDQERLRALGDAGVRLLLSDSTGAFSPGVAGGEARVAEALREIVLRAKGAVFVAVFASNVHRLRALGDVAREAGRRIVLVGRSLETHARVARRLGRLRWPSDLVWPRDGAASLARSSLLVVATGTQGEANGALARLARGDGEPRVLAGDTVVLSSRVVPGNDREVAAILDDLVRRGADVRSWMSDPELHASGHACAGEQRRMLELVRPRAFVPVHGTLHQLERHAALARAAGVEDARVLEDGDVLELGERTAKAGRVRTGRVHVHEGREVPAVVLAERARLATEGVVHVVVSDDATVAEVFTQGVVDAGAHPEILEDARRAAIAAAGGAAPGERVEQVRLAVRRVFARVTSTRPLTAVTVLSRAPGGASDAETPC